MDGGLTESKNLDISNGNIFGDFLMNTRKLMAVAVCSLIAIAIIADTACIPGTYWFTASTVEMVVTTPDDVDTLVQRGLLRRASVNDSDIAVAVSWVGAKHMEETFWISNRVINLMSLEERA